MVGELANEVRLQLAYIGEAKFLHHCLALGIVLPCVGGCLVAADVNLAIGEHLDNLVENYFWADLETIQQHKLFIRLRAEAIEKLTDELVFHIKIANSIYPTCMAEWEERRVV